MEQTRAMFVKECQEGMESISSLCRKYEISRPTAYKWIARYEADGNMSNLSSAPRTHPMKTLPEIEDAILALRREHPGTGARKIQHILKRRGIDVPSVKTVNAILKRNGCITLQASRAAQHYRRFEADHPNDIWQADFKGNFLMNDGERCYPLNIIDDHSRMCLCSAAQINERYEDTALNFTRTFREYGLPLALLCDNGNPWGTSQSTGFTRFEIWLMDLDILPMHGRSLHPQTQGKQERFNGSLKREMLAFADIDDLACAQRILQEYRRFYNCERPHEALDMRTPAEVYAPSPRAFPECIAEWEYTGCASVVKVKSSGYLSFQGQGCFLSEAFANRDVALIPSEDAADCLDILYRNFRIARYDIRERCMISKKTRRVKAKP